MSQLLRILSALAVMLTLLDKYLLPTKVQHVVTTTAATSDYNALLVFDCGFTPECVAKSPYVGL